MTAKENSLNWFEIPVSDINRATIFYETMAYFPYDPGSGKASGGLVKGPMHKPSVDGVKVYLNGNPDLSAALSKVEKAGGKITMPKTKINDDIGHMAFLVDTEGNTVALHSQK